MTEQRWQPIEGKVLCPDGRIIEADKFAISIGDGDGCTLLGTAEWPDENIRLCQWMEVATQPRWSNERIDKLIEDHPAKVYLTEDEIAQLIQVVRDDYEAETAKQQATQPAIPLIAIDSLLDNAFTHEETYEAAETVRKWLETQPSPYPSAEVESEEDYPYLDERAIEEVRSAVAKATQPAAEVVWQGEVSMPYGESGLLTDDRKTYIEIVELLGDEWLNPSWLSKDKRYRITVEQVQP